MKNRFAVVLMILTFTVSLGLLTACGGGNNTGNGEQNENAENPAGGEQQSGEGGGGEDSGEKSEELQKGVPVRVAEVNLGPISDGILSTSVVEAEQAVDIYPRVTGTVTRINAEEGQYVSEGQLLCALEDEELSLQESKSHAEMEKLKRDLERTETLVNKGIVTETDLSNAKYAYEQAEISWRQAKTNLEYTQIKSTINGIVSQRLVKLGQKVDPGTQLYSLFNPRSLVINVFIPENDYFLKIAEREKSITALITSDSLPGREFTGGIKRVAPIVDPETNTLKITLSYQDRQNTLKPGMYVRVKLITNTREQAVLIPKTAVLYDENQQVVFRIRDDKAQRIILEPGFEDTRFVESLAQLQDGDLVVVVGQNGLKDGTKVRIVEDIAADTPAEESE
jgi:membrane fusion protein (multidrug efflux system)